MTNSSNDHHTSRDGSNAEPLASFPSTSSSSPHSDGNYDDDDDYDESDPTTVDTANSPPLNTNKHRPQQQQQINEASPIDDSDTAIPHTAQVPQNNSIGGIGKFDTVSNNADYDICGLCAPEAAEDSEARIDREQQHEQHEQQHEEDEEDPQEKEKGVYINIVDRNSSDSFSVVSGLTFASDFHSSSPPCIGSITVLQSSVKNNKAILSPVVESSNPDHGGVLVSSSGDNNNTTKTDEQISQLSRLIATQEELVEKTRQINQRRKILIYSNIALLVVVVVAVSVGLILGMGGSSNNNLNDASSTTTIQQNNTLLPLDDETPPIIPANDITTSPTSISSPCYPMEVYATMSEHRSTTAAAAAAAIAMDNDTTITWTINDVTSNAEIRSGNVGKNFLSNNGSRGVILDNSFCLPGGTFTFRVNNANGMQNTNTTNNINNNNDDDTDDAIRFQVRTGEMPMDGGVLSETTTLVDTTTMSDGLDNNYLVLGFSLPPSSFSQLLITNSSTMVPSSFPTVIHPSVVAAYVPSAYPSIPPTLMGGDATTLPPFKNDTAVPTNGLTTGPTAPSPSPGTACFEVSFEIIADDFGQDTLVFLMASPFDAEGVDDASSDNDGILFQMAGFEPNKLFEYSACLPASEYTFVISDFNGNGLCCGGYFSLKVRPNNPATTTTTTTSEMDQVIIPLIIRNGTDFGGWDVTTFPLPFNSTSLYPLEVDMAPLPNSGVTWEVLQDGVVEFSKYFPSYNDDHTFSYHEVKYVPAGEYQFIGYNISVGDFLLLTEDPQDGGENAQMQVIGKTRKKVLFHSIIFPLPFHAEMYHLFEVYFETPSTYGKEIYWEVRDDEDVLFFNNHRAYSSLEIYLEAKYLLPGSYEFSVFDFTSQGLGDIGYFEIYLDGIRLDQFYALTSVNPSWYRYNFTFAI